MSETKKDDDKPIPGPEPVGPEYLLEPDWERPLTPVLALARWAASLVREPAHWVRKNIVEPNRGPEYYWYHRKYKRVLPVDECYFDDMACIYEAHIEFKRNQLVDKMTLELLRTRRDNCHLWWQTTKATHHRAEECKELDEIYQREEDNFFIKYGDMHHNSSVFQVYNKQKHRMIVERRNALAKQEKEKFKELEMNSEAS